MVRRSASALGIKVILALRDAPGTALSVHLDTFAAGPGHEPSGLVKWSARERAVVEDIFSRGGGGVPPQGRNINSSPSSGKVVLGSGRHFKRSLP
jgi:hypothetical protein